jgi:hypothetical protein
MIDADDRRVLAQLATLLISLVLVAIVIAATLGLAWNVFEFVRGF